MMVKKSPCEVFIFLVGISLFIFFAGFAIYIYVQFSRPAFEKSMMYVSLSDKFSIACRLITASRNFVM